MWSFRPGSMSKRKSDSAVPWGLTLAKLSHRPSRLRNGWRRPEPTLIPSSSARAGAAGKNAIPTVTTAIRPRAVFDGICSRPLPGPGDIGKRPDESRRSLLERADRGRIHGDRGEGAWVRGHVGEILRHFHSHHGSLVHVG